AIPLGVGQDLETLLAVDTGQPGAAMKPARHEPVALGPGGSPPAALQAQGADLALCIKAPGALAPHDTAGAHSQFGLTQLTSADQRRIVQPLAFGKRNIRRP